MLSTQNLALRNRRVDEVPPDAGDFARIINGSLFSLSIVKFCLSVLVFNVTSSTDAFRPVRSRQRGYGTTQMTRYAEQALQSQGFPKKYKIFLYRKFLRALAYTRGEKITPTNLRSVPTSRGTKAPRK